MTAANPVTLLQGDCRQAPEGATPGLPLEAAA